METIDALKEVLDHIGQTAIYVIRQDTHEILYFNRRVQEVTPEIRTGMICHDVWDGYCSSCPLKSIGEDETSESISYYDPFGPVVDIKATRMIWEDIPAYVISVSPHTSTQKEQQVEADFQAMITSVLALFGELLIVEVESGEYVSYKADESMETIRTRRDFEEFNLEYGEKLIHPEDRPRFFEVFSLTNIRRQIHQGIKRLSAEMRRKSGDGQYRWSEMIGIVMEDDTRKTRILLTFRDIQDIRTELDRRQEALRDALALAEEANAAKSDFLSRMSHDIRSPLNVIIGMTEIAAANLDKPEKIQDCLRKTEVSSKFLLELINDVLDMSRIESGQMRINAEPFDLHSLIQDITALGYTQAKQKQQAFSVFVDEAVEREYIGDSLRIHQILMNLIHNAVKYTPEGGHIRVDIQALPAAKTEELILKVTDDGIGMSEEFQQKMFDPFEQERSSGGRIFEGSGLGLSITQNLTHLMNGQISVQSTLGKGSTFTVEIPVGRSEGASNAMMEVLPELKALVVDDDQTVCRHMQLMLNKMGVQADWETDGFRAVQKVEEKLRRKERYDVVLIDWKMPGTDGVGTISQIRRLSGQKLLVIVMSAYDWSDIEDAARQAGADYFLSKPIFAENVHKLLLKISSPEQPIGAAASAAVFAGERVLLVEDNELNLEIAQTILEMAGLRVETAQNGQEGLKRFAETEPGYYRLILMDIRMPVMDGLEATRRIRAMNRPDAARIPIIAMTANAFHNEQSEAYRAGLSKYLTKPVDSVRILETVRQCLDEENGA